MTGGSRRYGHAPERPGALPHVRRRWEDDEMATPDETRDKIRRLRRGARLHWIFAVFFLAGSIYAYFDSPAPPEPGGRSRFLDSATETMIQWEVVLMGAGIAIANVFLAVAKSRRASRLAVDPDADHPEAKVFE